MGSRFTRFRENRNMSSSRTNRETGESDSDEDESSFAMILALMLRSGQVRLVRSGGSHLLEEASSSDSEPEDLSRCCPQSSCTSTNASIKGDLWNDFAFIRNDDSSSRMEEDKQHLFRPTNLSVNLRQREYKVCGPKKHEHFTSGFCTSVSSRFIPNHVCNKLKFREKMFCGTYSADGSLFLSACQDQHIRIFSTQYGLQTKPFKMIKAKDVGWSVLDTAFSPDSRFAAYSSWSTCIHLCTVHDGNDPNVEKHMALDLRPRQHNFAIFSLKFSWNGEEIICGSNDGYLYVYDLDRGERTLSIDAHEDDINAVCFADKSSQILYSGGDDGLVKVWDRRAFSESNTIPAGTLAGHQDGITFIDTKGDARYLLSNSKDQSVKLWDIRRFSSESAIDNVRRAVSNQSWDYRWQSAPKDLRLHKRSIIGDTSVQSYVGHKVTNTLIRARFSPLHTTGNRYIYSGCSSGRVFVYDLLTGKVVSKRKKHMQCVRDVSWHPHQHRMISSSWDGSIAEWDYNMGVTETDKND